MTLVFDLSLVAEKSNGINVPYTMNSPYRTRRTSAPRPTGGTWPSRSAISGAERVHGYASAGAKPSFSGCVKHTNSVPARRWCVSHTRQDSGGVFHTPDKTPLPEKRATTHGDQVNSWDHLLWYTQNNPQKPPMSPITDPAPEFPPVSASPRNRIAPTIFLLTRPLYLLTWLDATKQ